MVLRSEASNHNGFNFLMIVLLNVIEFVAIVAITFAAEAVFYSASVAITIAANAVFYFTSYWHSSSGSC